MEAKRSFSDSDWENTPAPVKEYVVNLERQVNELTSKVDLLFKRVEELENRINKNSSNSNKPPSSDPPYKRPKKKVKKSKQKRGAQKGHKGHRQTVLEPTDTIPVLPEACSCGNARFGNAAMVPFHTHQQIELPEIKMDVSHFVLHKCTCKNCGKIVKAQIPKAHGTGYGPD